MADRQAILRRLRALSKDWPSDLWLFAADGRLQVMEANEDGTRGVLPNGGMDPERVVTTINIPCDGGDW